MIIGWGQPIPFMVKNSMKWLGVPALMLGTVIGLTALTLPSAVANTVNNSSPQGVLPLANVHLNTGNPAVLDARRR